MLRLLLLTALAANIVLVASTKEEPKCNINEEYSNCTQAICRPQECSKKEELVACRQIAKGQCLKGCVCKKSFLKDANGKCIPEDQCPQKCKNGGNWNTCPPQQCKAEYCAVSRDDPPSCNSTKNCGTPRCTCGLNQKRDRNGKCIDIRDCPPFPCGSNEVYNACPSFCDDKCTNRNLTCGDPRIKIGVVVQCAPKCVCKKNYFRNSKGVCVKSSQCDEAPKCNINEEYSNCTQALWRQQECSKKGESLACPCIEEKDCLKGCVCKESFLKDANGNCIPEDQCPPKQCLNLNEIWVACPNPCDPNTCESIGKIFYCPIQKKQPCKGECRCKPGYWRNAIGDCITKKECLQCNKKNEFFSCGGACDNICSNLDQQNQTNCPIINIKCNPMCYCKSGYARDSFGECIPISECRNCTGDHEYYDKCPRYCKPDTCPIPGIVIDCAREPDPPICMPSCRCEDNYARNPEGNCVPKQDCPCGDDPNATYGSGCGVRCDRLCSSYNRTKPILCPDVCYTDRCDCKIGFVYDEIKKLCVLPDDCSTTSPTQCRKNEVYDRCLTSCPPRVCGINDAAVLCAPVNKSTCTPGCRCQDGFVRNPDGDCVAPEKCPPIQPQCRKNEVYDRCLTSCPPRVCGINDAAVLCAQVNESTCMPGCRCQDGFVRNPDGDCVAPEKCPPIQQQCLNLNEIWVACPNPCDPNTCESIGKIFYCPLQKKQPCKGECRCKAGYWRNAIGDCITKKECLQCNKKNEFFSCGGACDNVCSNLDQQNQTNCPIINIKCNPMCYCKSGYARDSFGECIPISECRNCTGDHEYYDKCPRYCKPDTCPIPGIVIDCAREPDPPICIPSCRCEDNYARNPEGDCVRKQDCPCGDDPNATYGSGCGVRCDRLCSSYNRTKPILCPAVCYTDRCDCKIGFVYDEIKKLCVLPDDCSTTSPTQCRKNEVYDRCLTSCPPRVCGINDAAVLCAPVNKSTCTPGCRCQDGFVRNPDGDCVAPEKCPPIQLQCNKKNEFFSCGGACDNVCSNLGQQNQTNCPIINVACNRMCYCKSGYARDSFGECIPISECRNCTGDHEYFDKCPRNCPPETCPVPGAVYDCPQESYPPKCNPSCRCEDNYARNPEGDCVPMQDCPCGDDPNATYGSGCGVRCDRLCSTYNSTEPVLCPAVCYTDRCDCKIGFVYDEIKKLCVLPDDCSSPPPKCKDGGTWNICPPQECKAEYCAKSRDDPSSCISTKNCGAPRCTCGFNQKRDSNGKCIAIRDCPPFPCGRNELYNACPSICGDKCTDRNSTCGNPLFRNDRVIPCTPKCVCKKNYFRNSHGLCVKSCQCDEAPITTTPATTPTTTDNGNQTYDLDQLTHGVNEFTFQFLKEAFKSKPGENLVFSSVSVQLAFGLLVLYSRNNTQRQLLDSFGLSSPDQFRRAINPFVKKLASNGNVTLASAVLAAINKNIEVLPDFIEDIKLFNGTVQYIDCSNPPEAANVVNSYVEKNTFGKIKNLIPQDAINELVRIILVNAIYFKGSWKVPFNKNLTKDRDFHTYDNRTVQVPTMYKETKLPYFYSNDLQAHVVELEYTPEYKMVVVLPREKDGLQETITKLNADTLQKALDTTQTRNVKLWLPTMKIESTLNLNKQLQNMGLKDMFIPGLANFTGIMKNPEELHVSNVFHKANLEVNEEGAVAAAATGVIVSTYSAQITLQPEPEIRCDHPFFFTILAGKSVVFSGTKIK